MGGIYKVIDASHIEKPVDRQPDSGRHELGFGVEAEVKAA
jgi:hypothetical protein